MNFITKIFLLPKFAISQTEALSTALMSCDVKSLFFWSDIWTNLDMANCLFCCTSAVHQAHLVSHGHFGLPDMLPKCAKKVQLGTSTTQECRYFIIYMYKCILTKYTIFIFTITAEIHTNSLVYFYCQYADRQTHEFEIHATRQRVRAGNSTICYRKKTN